MKSPEPWTNTNTNTNTNGLLTTEFVSTDMSNQ